VTVLVAGSAAGADILEAARFVDKPSQVTSTSRSGLQQPDTEFAESRLKTVTGRLLSPQ
jgi:hypothetical protein